MSCLFACQSFAFVSLLIVQHTNTHTSIHTHIEFWKAKSGNNCESSDNVVVVDVVCCSCIHLCKITCPIYRQQSLLSDEQAREVEQILSNNKELPPLPKEPPRKRSDDEPDWLRDVLEVNNKSDLPPYSSSKQQDSIISVESNQSANESVHTTSAADNSKLESQRDGSIISSAASLVGGDADVSGDESNAHSLQMEYPPVPSKEVFVNQDGVHFFEDGNFWMEVPGLLENDHEDEDPNIPVKKGFKIKFSTAPIQVFSTFSVNDYDRRNEDVDPVAASAEYELEKRVEKVSFAFVIE